jgi:hypothetical protein
LIGFHVVCVYRNKKDFAAVVDGRNARGARAGEGAFIWDAWGLHGGPMEKGLAGVYF